MQLLSSNLVINQVVKQTTNLKILAATAAVSLLATVLPMSTTTVNTSSMTSRETERASQAGLILASAAVVGLGIGALQASKNSSHTGISSYQTPKRSQVNAISLEQVNGKLRTQLLTLLHKDVQTANRLLTQAMFKYPDRTINWYAEKVIYDLTRDRGAY